MTAVPESRRDFPFVPIWVAGERQEARATRFGEVFNPATGKAIRHAPLCGVDDVERAVDAAGEAFPAWRDTRPLHRARILMRFRELLEVNKEALARLVTEENGKTLEDARGSIRRGIEAVEFATGVAHLLKGEFAENVGAGVDCFSLRQPLGVCIGVTPFCFPAMVPLWMFPVAIACGNTFVLKPSERVPSASVRLAELLHEAGAPPGVFNVVHGDAEAVDALLHRPRVAAVSFVGSTPVARHVYESGARAHKRVQALGGAKNHAVVLPDAHLPLAADALLGAAYGSAGENCMAVSAVLAVGGCADALVDLLGNKAAAIRLGPGDLTGVDMGPLISAAHLERVTGYIEKGMAERATLVLDGRGISVAGHERGFFLGPTLFDHVESGMSIYRDEILGPVLAVLRVPTLAEAIELINLNPWANSAAIFTRSGAAARRFQNEVSVGMVDINLALPVPAAAFAFGGWNQSMLGDLYVHGMDGVRFYTRGKVVTAHWPGDAGAGPDLHVPANA